MAAFQMENKGGSGIAMRKRIVWAAVVIAAGIAVWACRDRYGGKMDIDRTTAEERPGDAAGLEQKMLSFTVDGRSSKGVKQWHLEAGSAKIKGNEIHLNELGAVVLGDDAAVNLTSDKGIYDRDEGEVELIGSVTVVSDEGFTLTTDRANWSQAAKEISTDTIVRIEREGMTAVGKGGMANSDERKAVLKESVMVIMEPDTKINCDGPLEVSYNDNIAVFYNNVMVEDEDGTLLADKLTVEFDPETQELAQVTAEGNVKVKRGKSYTMSEKAIYSGSTGRAKLLGNPRVIIDSGELAEFEESGGLMGPEKEPEPENNG